jgi:hypothetical protein
MGHAKEKAAIRAKGKGQFIEYIQWRDSRCTMVFNRPKIRGMTWPGNGGASD